jgi:hypothetical protein
MTIFQSAEWRFADPTGSVGGSATNPEELMARLAD